MLFRKKLKLRSVEHQRLLQSIDHFKQRLDYERHFITHSVDPSDDILARAKANESVYSFLLREVRAQTKNK